MSCDNNPRNLSTKVVTLLAILSGQRAREILSVMDIRNTTVKSELCTIRIGDLLKTSNRKFHVGELKFPEFRDNPSICPVNCLRQYLAYTKPLRGVHTKIFLTLTKPYKPASADTLSRWIRAAGVDMSIFSPHSTRSASTSFAKPRVPMDTILKTGGWRSMKTFAVYYDKPVENEEVGL